MAQRQRGYFLEKDDIEVLRHQYKGSRWKNYRGWAMQAHVSASTIKRLLKGDSVEKESLESAIEALGLIVEDFVFKQVVIPATSENLIQPSVLVPLSNPEFYMRVTFPDTNKRQMQYALDDLRELLDGQSLQISEIDGGNCVTISSDFPEGLRDDVETVLKHIQSLADKCVMKGDLALVGS